MTALRQLLRSLPVELAVEIIHGNLESKITGITDNSRDADPGSLFVAVKGTKVDGHDFISQVVAQGCRCLVVETDPDPRCELHEATIIRVNDSHAALGCFSAALHGFPARDMTMIGLTGTNGKTTVSWMLEEMLRSDGCRVGVIGTVNYRYPDRSGRSVVKSAPLTTPGPILLQRLLWDMAEQGVTHVIMETSSHALYQGRLEAICFDAAVFTNLSRDHLDFHGGMNAYFAAKKLLFTRFLKDDGQAVIVTGQGTREKNWGARLCRELAAERPSIQYTECDLARQDQQGQQNEQAAVFADKLTQSMQGFSCRLKLIGKTFAFRSALIGRHNVLNLLAAAGVGTALGMAPEQIIAGLEQVGQVPGRLERVLLPGISEEEQPCVLVDYAHTPDALKNVLQTLRSLTEEQLICVFGCGGDRDQGKRPLMGAVAAECASISIVTSDNPRSENPRDIIQHIAQGAGSMGAVERTIEELFGDQAVQDGDFPGFVCIEDRKTAVHVACVLAGPGDIVLLAGKGHEDYQIIGKERIFFDDRLEALNGLLHWNPRHLLQAVRAVDRRASRGRSNIGPHLFNHISTDTRTLTAGDIFVALQGDNFDGHDYLRVAADAGAGAVVVQQDIELKNHNLPDNLLVIRVEDTLQALNELAAYRRRLLHPSLPLIAITGSCGKTTVKEMVASIFSRHIETAIDTGIDTLVPVDPVLKTKGNFNNLVGLPLSLLPLEAGHKVAIMEMGMNRFGEIARLTATADPDIACITNVQAAHLEGLGSIEGVAQAKGELFAGMRPDTTAVVNYDDPHVRKLPINSRTVIGFAVTAAGRRRKPAVRATRLADCGEDGMRFTLHIDDWSKRINVRVPGLHNVSNCTAAAAVAHAANVAPETVVNALISFQSTDKRMQFMTLPGGVRVLNDCYNANPASMSAALRTVRSFGNGNDDCKRVALLGDMLELGQEAPAAHKQLGREVAELGYDCLAVTGDRAGHIAQGAEQAGMKKKNMYIFTDTHAMADWLYHEIIQQKLKADDWVLLKGSRGMRMETVPEEIRCRFATGISREQQN